MFSDLFPTATSLNKEGLPVSTDTPRGSNEEHYVGGGIHSGPDIRSCNYSTTTTRSAEC